MMVKRYYVLFQLFFTGQNDNLKSRKNNIKRAKLNYASYVYLC